MPLRQHLFLDHETRRCYLGSARPLTTRPTASKHKRKVLYDTLAAARYDFYAGAPGVRHNVALAAKRLGIPVSTAYRWLRFAARAWD